MSNQADKSTTDQILDLLLDALAERQRARQTKTGTGRQPSGVYVPPETSAAERAESRAQPSPPFEPGPPSPASPPVTQKAAPQAQPQVPSPLPPPRPEPRLVEQRRRTSPVYGMPPPPPQVGEAGWEPPPRVPSINMAKTLGRLLLLVVALLILVNVPVTRYGVSLAHILPDSAALVIRDGLVLKGSGPEIYILRDDKLRWISSLDAFEHLGLTWEDVHEVEDVFLDKFEKGQPLHVLLKCQASPHIYRLENNQKRWIKDIDTFQAEGHIWEDVRFVSCQYLRDLPTGPSIPEDAGPAPEP
jgi:hypothetical protein